jgi:pyridoxal phosphate enzyme (YggS family)
VTLIAVTKTYPASDVLHLAALGVTDVGENRDQEAAPKAAEVAAGGTEVSWHYIGQLQRNKCRSVASYADVVHSVDRLPLVAALASAREAASAESGVPPLSVLIQVNLDISRSPGGRSLRGGADPADVASIADAIATAPSLRLAGVMAVAPLDAVGAELAAAFAAIAAVSADLRATYPEATVISAGMSADFELAISYGATHVRVGSLLLGPRPPLG